MQTPNVNEIPLVDQWSEKTPEEKIFTNSKNMIIAQLSAFFHTEQNVKINYFMINPKKSYNSDDLRDHNCRYLNYFEKFRY